MREGISMEGAFWCLLSPFGSPFPLPLPVQFFRIGNGQELGIGKSAHFPYRIQTDDWMQCNWIGTYTIHATMHYTASVIQNYEWPLQLCRPRTRPQEEYGLAARWTPLSPLRRHRPLTTVPRPPSAAERFAWRALCLSLVSLSLQPAHGIVGSTGDGTSVVRGRGRVGR